MDQRSEEERSIQRSRNIGAILMAISLTLIGIYLWGDPNWSKGYHLTFISAILFVLGLLFLLPINYYLFDVKDWEENKDVRMVIKKLRLRAIVFNNLSVLILIIAVIVIALSFYQIGHPNTNIYSNKSPDSLNNYVWLASQVGSIIVLIFLVQILFRVFKYLVRVGGFYNGKADALELCLLDDGKTYKIDTLLESLTPQSYDMSDVDSPNLYPGK